MQRRGGRALLHALWHRVRCHRPRITAINPHNNPTPENKTRTRTHTHNTYSPNGNVPPASDPHKEFPGQNVIHLTPGAQLHDLLPSSMNVQWHDVAARGLLALMRAREGRARPHRVRMD